MFGTSARFLTDLYERNICPSKSFVSQRWHQIIDLHRSEQTIDLSSLRTVSSTGSVLPARVCEWFYDTSFPDTVHLVSGSGGTDLACSRKNHDGVPIVNQSLIVFFFSCLWRSHKPRLLGRDTSSRTGNGDRHPRLRKRPTRLHPEDWRTWRAGLLSAIPLGACRVLGQRRDDKVSASIFRAIRKYHLDPRRLRFIFSVDRRFYDAGQKVSNRGTTRFPRGQQM